MQNVNTHYEYKISHTEFIIIFLALRERRRLGDDYDEANDGFLENMYTIDQVEHIRIPAFQTEGRDYRILLDYAAFPPGISYLECEQRIYRIFQGIINDLLGPLPDNAHARMIIMPGNAENENDDENLVVPVSTSFQRVRLITPELILAKIANIGQSKRGFVLDNMFRIHIIHTVHLGGNGRKSNCIQIRNKKSVFAVCSNTNRCLAESIILGIELHEKGKYVIMLYFNVHFYYIFG